MECRLKGAGVHYQIHGEGRPLLALHGWGLDHRIVANTLEPILRRRTGWKRIYPDLPGMGKTKAPEWLTTSDQMLDVLAGFVDRVAPGERFSVLGVSYGGYLAHGLLHRMADRMDGICLIGAGTTPGPAKPVSPTPILRRERIDFGGASEESVSSFRAAVVIQTQKQFDAWERDVVPAERLADMPFLSWLEKGARLSFDVNVHAQPFLRPALLIHGHQDGEPTHRDTAKILAAFPRGTLAVLDGAGRFLPIEQMTLLAALLQEWLDRVEEASLAGAPSLPSGIREASPASAPLAPARTL